MDITDYDYDLPEELIAQEPAAARDQSRLMVLDRDDRTINHRSFRDLGEFLRPGDLVVINDTRVFPARLIGEKSDTGGEVELLLLREDGDGSWEALARPGKRLRAGSGIVFGGGMIRAVIESKGDDGRVRARLSSDAPFHEAIDATGRVPLPPYIHRDPDPADRERYQTVYARERGSVAAPTAGLHFTPGLLDTLLDRGIQTAAVTLHVGIGTFRPLTGDDMGRDTLHEEFYTIPDDTVAAVERCRKSGGRVLAVGTTTTRALESASTSGELTAASGWTDLFIRPPYSFRSVDMMVTNFHLPRSSLLMLVSTFAGRDFVLDAYREAVRGRYRFYSYGDAMLIIGNRR